MSALCVRKALSVVVSGNSGTCWLQDTTRMSMTVVVREALCVYAGDAWALQGRSLFRV